MNSQHKPTLIYYVHHHGSGHRSRFAMLIPELARRFNVVVIVANTEQAEHLVSSEYEVRVMPSKWPQIMRHDFEHTFTKAFEGVLYSESAALRSQWFSQLILDTKPSVFLSDGSIELLIMARSMGVQSVLMRMNGSYQQDPTQVFAYEAADYVIAPYPQKIEDTGYAYAHKTMYNGLFSRYQPVGTSQPETKEITILLGYENMSEKTVQTIISVPGYSFNIIGNKSEIPNLSHVTQHGRVPDIKNYITGNIVISASGHNSIAELIALKKQLVLLPEDRPYDEQLHKARAMEREGCAVTAHEDFDVKEWANALSKAASIDTSLFEHLIDNEAPKNIAKELEQRYG